VVAVKLTVEPVWAMATTASSASISKPVERALACNGGFSLRTDAGTEVPVAG
jgi:hypothetical protein